MTDIEINPTPENQASPASTPAAPPTPEPAAPVALVTVPPAAEPPPAPPAAPPQEPAKTAPVELIPPPAPPNPAKTHAAPVKKAPPAPVLKVVLSMQAGIALVGISKTGCDPIFTKYDGVPLAAVVAKFPELLASAQAHWKGSPKNPTAAAVTPATPPAPAKTAPTKAPPPAKPPVAKPGSMDRIV